MLLITERPRTLIKHHRFEGRSLKILHILNYKKYIHNASQHKIVDICILWRELKKEIFIETFMSNQQAAFDVSFKVWPVFTTPMSRAQPGLRQLPVHGIRDPEPRLDTTAWGVPNPPWGTLTTLFCIESNVPPRVTQIEGGEFRPREGEQAAGGGTWQARTEVAAGEGVDDADDGAEVPLPGPVAVGADRRHPAPERKIA